MTMNTRQHHNSNITAPPSQIAFVPDAPNSDLYGAVNCCHYSPAVVEVAGNNNNSNNITGGGGDDDGDDIIGGSKSSLRLKLGPPLLEIRRLKYSLYDIINNNNNNNDNNDDDDGRNQAAKTKRRTTTQRNVDFRSRLDDDDDEDEDAMKHNEAHLKTMQISSSSSSSFVHHETVLISRGIPGLGGNVSSTCLDFRPSNNNNNNNINNTYSCSTQTDSGGIGIEDSSSSGDGHDVVVRCATGLTSGSLCVHSFSNLFHYCSNDGRPSSSSSSQQPQPPTSTVAYYAPRQQRPATSVAWRPSSGGGGGGGGGASNLVAVGLVGIGSYGVFSSSIGEEEVGGGAGLSTKQRVLGIGGGGGGSIYSSIKATSTSQLMDGVIGVSSSLTSSHLSSIGSTGRFPAAATGKGSNIGGGGGDRDFGTLVWDIEAQSSVVGGAGTLVGGGGKKGGSSASVGSVGKGGMATTVPVKTPAYRFAHNCGVESLAWLCDGQVLAVGCQRQSFQLYDLRVSGTNAPPTSVFAHTEMVSGIVPDNSGSNSSIFATFGRNVGEPVKIWDARKIQSHVGEIIPSGAGRRSGACVSAVAWSISHPGVISIAIGNSIKNYDTRSHGLRAMPVGVSYVDSCDHGDDDTNIIQCLAYQPQIFRSGPEAAKSASSTIIANPLELYRRRALAVTSTGRIQVVPESQIAPVAISIRDGRVANSLGRAVWIGPTTEGPSAMECRSVSSEDISSRMMRRARCSNAFPYSTDALVNLRMLKDEKERILAEEEVVLRKRQRSESLKQSSSNIEQLMHCWRWIALVELSTFDQKGSESNETALPHSIVWTANSLIDAGIMKLMRMSSRDVQDESSDWIDTKTTSETLSCDVFDSPLRRAALYACGWVIKDGALPDLLAECQSRGEYERSAALAAWHGDLNLCIDSLQRAADDTRTRVKGGEEKHGYIPDNHSRDTYSETLSLIAMCVAGFNVTPTSCDGILKSTKLWCSACNNLLTRLDASMMNDIPQLQLRGVFYLRSILLFLQDIGSNSGFKRTIYDDAICLADRVGFACRFLPWSDLHAFLEASMRKCMVVGNLEGLLITGLDKRGISLLQSYTDQSSDVQTAALISCRVVLPTDWACERKMCLEWLESYRLFLNGLQMWNSRASFDVGRFEHLRRIKQGGLVSSSSGRQSSTVKPNLEKSQPNNSFPPQLWARCNYCNSPLPLSKLRRQEGVANSWLSRQKPVLTCCPQCKKPLPRCSICLLSLGCLNPYMELQRERNQYSRSGTSGIGGGGNYQATEDLSGLASVPFATWFSWCMRCKHGGHAHHLCAWFEKHDICAVSGCDCRCQLDGIKKMTRPGLT